MDYSRIVPHDSFLGRYLSFMEAQETALIYDVWCGLWCLSVACARNTFVDRPRAPVYLNLYTILVGESGIPRKTTSVHMATRVVRTIVGHERDVGLIDAKITPEALDLLLHERTMEFGSAQMCATVPELAVFLGTERYIAHMPTLLTDLYDCPSVREGGGTIARGAIAQRNVWFSMLSASTPIWLLKTVNPNVIEGGFTSRCFFIVSNEPKKRIPWPTDQDDELLKDICDDIKIIHTEARARGPIKLTPEALEVFTTWYGKRIHNTADMFMQSFEAREDAHILRIAALLSINDGTWLIRRAHLRIAIRLVAEVKETSCKIFEQSERMTKYAIALDKVRSMLVSKGMDPVRRSDLHRVCRHLISRDEFITLLEVLHEIGAIQRFVYRSGDRGAPTDFVRGTNLILSKGIGASVLDRFS